MKILVISSNLIGDTILSTGVIEHFYKNNPQDKFTFLIGTKAGQIYKHFPALEKIILIKKLKEYEFEKLKQILMKNLVPNSTTDLIVNKSLLLENNFQNIFREFQ